MSRPTITAFYANAQITGSAALDAFAAAIDSYKDLGVESANWGESDPAVWVTKYAMIFYSLGEGLPFRMRVAQDFSSLVFSTDIISIVWGNYEVKSQQVYTQMYNALIANQGYPANLESMGGYDPQVGVVKTASVIYVKNGVKYNTVAQEGGTLQWK